MSNLDFSLIIPVGSVTGLEETIYSIQAQIGISYEIILVVRNVHIKKNLSQRFPIAKVILEDQPGVYGALNTGLSHASGAIVQFISVGAILAGPDILVEIRDTFFQNQHLEALFGGWLQKRSANLANRFAPSSKQSLLHFWGFSILNIEALALSKKLVGDRLIFSLQFEIASDFEFLGRVLRKTSVGILPVTWTILPPPGLSVTKSRLGYKEVRQIRVSRAKVLFGWPGVLVLHAIDILLFRSQNRPKWVEDVVLKN